MTPDQQRIAIATACGWTTKHKGLWVEKSQTYAALPDYLNDKNAMHEAKKVLTDDQAWEMVKIIVDYKQSANGFPMLSRSEALKLRSATARQEAEAFLRTLGLWEKEQ